MILKKLCAADLNRFTGSANVWVHSVNSAVVYSEGAKYVADRGGAHWLLDKIAIFQQCIRRVAATDFQIWTLSVQQDQSATLTCRDDDSHVLYKERLYYTDFPLDEVTLWFKESTILLPSEH
jgi:uncharacterized protein DUF6876